MAAGAAGKEETADKISMGCDVGLGLVEEEAKKTVDIVADCTREGGEKNCKDNLSQDMVEKKETAQTIVELAGR